MFLFLFGLALNSHGQLQSPPIEAGEVCAMAIGDYLDLGDVTGTEGQVWDFASGATQSGGWSWNALDVSTSDFGASFPNATIALENDGSWDYWSFGEEYTYHGGMEGNLLVVYSDPEVYCQYPFAVGETWEDEFVAEYGAAGITVYRTGALTNTMQASGQLTSPTGAIYDEVYRGTLEEVQTDSTFAGTITTTTTSEYFFSSNYGFPLLMSVSEHTLDTPLGGTPLETEEFYTIWLDTYTLGLPALDDLKENWALVPNPANETVSIIRGNESSDMPVTILDLNGAAALHGALVFGQNQTTLDVSGLAAGVYIVQTGPNTAAQRLVITH